METVVIICIAICVVLVIVAALAPDISTAEAFWKAAAIMCGFTFIVLFAMFVITWLEAFTTENSILIYSGAKIGVLTLQNLLR